MPQPIHEVIVQRSVLADGDSLLDTAHVRMQRVDTAVDDGDADATAAVLA
jgi:hypothetical protein